MGADGPIVVHTRAVSVPADMPNQVEATDQNRSMCLFQFYRSLIRLSNSLLRSSIIPVQP
jgi:hypothetical protein